MITPANFLTNNYLAPLRHFILEHSAIDHITVVDEGVFERISVDNAIFVVVAGRPNTGTFRIVHVQLEREHLIEKSKIVVSTERALCDEHVLFTGTSQRAFSELQDRIYRKSIKLDEIADVNFGKQLRNRKEYTADVIEVSSLDNITAPYKPCYTGRNVSRYYIEWANLACFDDKAAQRGGCWDADRHNRKNKLITRQIGQYPEFALDPLGFQCLNTLFMVNLRNQAIEPHFVLGLLNSKVIRAMWLDRFYDQRRTFPKIKGTYLKQLPICSIDFSNPTDKARHDRMVALVELMLDLHKQLPEAKTPQTQTVLQRQIETTDRQIDKLVYELYGLTDEEIKIVEESLE